MLAFGFFSFRHQAYQAYHDEERTYCCFIVDIFIIRWATMTRQTHHNLSIISFWQIQDHFKYRIVYTQFTQNFKYPFYDRFSMNKMKKKNEHEQEVEKKEIHTTNFFYSQNIFFLLCHSTVDLVCDIFFYFFFFIAAAGVAKMIWMIFLNFPRICGVVCSCWLLNDCFSHFFFFSSGNRVKFWNIRGECEYDRFV